MVEKSIIMEVQLKLGNQSIWVSHFKFDIKTKIDAILPYLNFYDFHFGTNNVKN